jgi:hypothetical protein
MHPLVLRAAGLSLCGALAGCLVPKATEAPPPATPPPAPVKTHSVLAKPGTQSVEIVVVNRTSKVVNSVWIANGEYSDIPQVLPPGQRASFRIDPNSEKGPTGKWNVTISDKPSAVQGFASHHFDLPGPTELVFYDGARPNDPPTPGFTQHIVPTHLQVLADGKSAANSHLAESKATCAKRVPRQGEKPRPGRTRATGHWKCVLGGSFSGTDFVDLVQLADGRITATLSGVDRDSTWEGVVVGKEVHFRFANRSLSGGVLVLDGGGRAMCGTAWSMTNSNDCAEWTLTCTRSR